MNSMLWSQVQHWCCGFRISVGPIAIALRLRTFCKVRMPEDLDQQHSKVLTGRYDCFWRQRCHIQKTDSEAGRLAGDCSSVQQQSGRCCHATTYFPTLRVCSKHV